MKNQTTQAPQSMFESVSMKAREWLESMNLSFERVSYFVLSLIVGFVAGFFFKKLGRPVFILIVSIGLIMVLLHYFGIVTVHWSVIKSQLGLAESADFKTVMQMLWIWIKDHIAFLACGLVGFLLGYKMA